MYTTAGLSDLHRRANHSYSMLLEHLKELPEDKLTTSIEGFGFTTVKDQLLHIVGAEHFWLGMLTGVKTAGWEDEEIRTVADLQDIFTRIAGETQDYLAGLGEDLLNARVELVFPDGSFHSTPGLVMAHVITHGFHHKGQLAAMCRLLGLPTGDTDLVIGLK